MLCPYCYHNQTKVVDKRETDEDKVTRRRRECLKCHKRFTTYERVESIDFYVIKKDSRREPYSREKLKTGFLKALEKRPVSLEKIEKTVDKIEARIRRRKKKEISSSYIGDLVIKELKKLDPVAYIRFASVYENFKDIKDFKKRIKGLK